MSENVILKIKVIYLKIQNFLQFLRIQSLLCGRIIRSPQHRLAEKSSLSPIVLTQNCFLFEHLISLKNIWKNIHKKEFFGEVWFHESKRYRVWGNHNGLECLHIEKTQLWSPTRLFAVSMDKFFFLMNQSFCFRKYYLHHKNEK